MITLRDKLKELLETAEYLPDGAIEAEASAFLAQALDWPVSTQVPLSRMVYVLASLLREHDVNVRRVRMTDALAARDSIG